ncbi:MAG TPA: hypothetical protein VKP88_08945, partial [Candidatus Paceibacterota bacterium]|nr:hypothetical protein [Candidatus Paceibacterota bacterium]
LVTGPGVIPKVGEPDGTTEVVVQPGTRVKVDVGTEVVPVTKEFELKEDGAVEEIFTPPSAAELEALANRFGGGFNYQPPTTDGLMSSAERSLETSQDYLESLERANPNALSDPAFQDAVEHAQFTNRLRETGELTEAELRELNREQIALNEAAAASLRQEIARNPFDTQRGDAPSPTTPAPIDDPFADGNLLPPEPSPTYESWERERTMAEQAAQYAESLAVANPGANNNSQYQQAQAAANELERALNDPNTTATEFRELTIRQRELNQEAFDSLSDPYFNERQDPGGEFGTVNPERNETPTEPEEPTQSRIGAILDTVRSALGLPTANPLNDTRNLGQFDPWDEVDPIAGEFGGTNNQPETRSPDDFQYSDRPSNSDTPSTEGQAPTAEDLIELAGGRDTGATEPARPVADGSRIGDDFLVRMDTNDDGELDTPVSLAPGEEYLDTGYTVDQNGRVVSLNPDANDPRAGTSFTGAEGSRPPTTETDTVAQADNTASTEPSETFIERVGSAARSALSAIGGLSGGDTQPTQSPTITSSGGPRLDEFQEPIATANSGEIARQGEILNQAREEVRALQATLANQNDPEAQELLDAAQASLDQAEERFFETANAIAEPGTLSEFELSELRSDVVRSVALSQANAQVGREIAAGSYDPSDQVPQIDIEPLAANSDLPTEAEFEADIRARMAAGRTYDQALIDYALENPQHVAQMSRNIVEAIDPETGLPYETTQMPLAIQFRDDALFVANASPAQTNRWFAATGQEYLTQPITGQGVDLSANPQIPDGNIDPSTGRRVDQLTNSLRFSRDITADILAACGSTRECGDEVISDVGKHTVADANNPNNLRLAGWDSIQGSNFDEGTSVHFPGEEDLDDTWFDYASVVQGRVTGRTSVTDGSPEQEVLARAATLAASYGVDETSIRPSYEPENVPPVDSSPRPIARGDDGSPARPQSVLASALSITRSALGINRPADNLTGREVTTALEEFNGDVPVATTRVSDFAQSAAVWSVANQMLEDPAYEYRAPEINSMLAAEFVEQNDIQTARAHAVSAYHGLIAEDDEPISSRELAAINENTRRVNAAITNAGSDDVPLQ